MTDPELLEKIRQAIMRYRELLNLVHGRVASAESGYEALFHRVPEEKRASLREKDLQREAALLALEDLEPLRRAVLKVHFDLREMERAFEELYNLIAPEEESQ